MRQQLWALIVKEFIAIWLDKKSRIVLIVPPILQLFLFAHAATLDVNNIHIGIWNRDVGKKSYELINRINGSPVFSKIHMLYSQEELQKKIDEQKILLALSLEDTFSKKIEAKQPVDIQIILDGRRSNSAQIAQGYLSNIITTFQQELIPVRQIEHAQMNTHLVQRNAYNENLIYTWFTVPGLVCILTTVVTITLTTMSIARERELGTLEQLLVAPLDPIQILVGKTLPVLIIGMIEGSIILLCAIFIFHVPFTGSLLALYISMFFYIMSIVGIGLFTSAISKTQQQGMLGVYLFMMPGITLSGFATPIDNMPSWLQTLTMLNPLRHFLFIVRGLFLKDLPTAVVYTHLLPIFLISLCTASGAIWIFKTKIKN